MIKKNPWKKMTKIKMDHLRTRKERARLLQTAMNFLLTLMRLQIIIIAKRNLSWIRQKILHHTKSLLKFKLQIRLLKIGKK